MLDLWKMPGFRMWFSPDDGKGGVGGKGGDENKDDEAADEDEEDEEEDEKPEEDEAFDKPRAMGTIHKLRDAAKTLKGTNKELQKQLKAVSQRLAGLEAEDKKRKTAELSEVDRLKAEKKELEGEVQTTKSRLRETALKSAVMSQATKAKFADAEDAFVHLEHSGDLKDLDPEAADTAKVIKDALKALAEKKPYLIEADDEEEVGADGKRKTPKRPGKKDGQMPDVAELRAKQPKIGL